MTALESAMIAEARRREPNLRPAGSRARLEDCFTTEPRLGVRILWFNEPGGSTKTVIRRIDGRA